MDNSEIIKQIFAERLKGLREAAGLTQQELGDLLGYSRGSISFYEKAQRVPDIVFLDAVSMFFDVSVNFLLGYTENKKSKNEDLGIRFGLSDEAIEILDDIELCEYRDFISGVVKHKLFPRLLECMELYSTPHEKGPFHLSYLDQYEFRHFQLTRIIMTILNDLQKDFIMCGKTVTALDNVDEEKRTRFLMDMLSQSNADTDRIIAEYEAERQADIQRRNRAMAEKFKEWEEREEQGRKARIAARNYVAAVDSTEGGGKNGND